MDAISQIRTTFLMKQLERKFHHSTIASRFEKLIIQPHKSILIVAPHPDDEVIGCGGLIQSVKKYKDSTIHVLFVTIENEKSVVKPTLTNGKNTRLLESEKAKQILAYDGASYLNIEERTIGSGKQTLHVLERKIKDILLKSNVNFVLVPNHFDMNPDHRAICEGSLKHINTLLEEDILPSLEKIYLYEIWGPVKATHFVPMTKDFYNKKILAMRCYETQTRSADYESIIAKIYQIRKDQLSQSSLIDESALLHSSEFYECIEPHVLSNYIKQEFSNND